MPYCRECSAWVELGKAATLRTWTKGGIVGHCRRHAPRPVFGMETAESVKVGGGTWGRGKGSAEKNVKDAQTPEIGMLQCWPQTLEDDWCLEGVQRQ